MRRPLCAAGAVYLAVLFILQLIFPIARPIIKVGCDDHASVIDSSDDEVCAVLIGRVTSREFRTYSGVRTPVVCVKSEKIYLKGRCENCNDYDNKESCTIICTLNGTAAPQVGCRIKLSGKISLYDQATNPGEFDMCRYEQTLGVDGKMRNAVIIARSKSYSRLQEPLACFRDRSGEILIETFGEHDGGILSAMVLGDKSNLDDEVKAMYQRNGIIHILAISGLHISLLGMGIYKLLKKCRAHTVIAAIISVIMMYFYGIMCGMASSAERAIVMFALAMAAKMIGRTYDLLTALCTAAVMIATQQPLYLQYSGFLFSFGAVFAIGLLLPAAEEMFPGPDMRRSMITRDQMESRRFRLHLKIKEKLVSVRAVFLSGIVVAVATLPVHLYFFYEFPVFSLLLNVLVIPLMTFVMAGTLIGLSLSFIWMPLGKLVVLPVHMILSLYDTGCRIGDALPVNEIVTGKPYLWQIFVYCTLIMIIFIFRKYMPRIIFSLLIVASALVMLVHIDTGLDVIFADVGQGDGIYISDNKGLDILVDGGSSTKTKVGKYQLEPLLKSKGAGRLDAVFITHLDSDHYNGILELIEMSDEGGVGIDEIVLNPEVYSAGGEKMDELLKMTAAHGIPVTKIHAGMAISKGKLKLTCLYPGAATTEKVMDVGKNVTGADSGINVNTEATGTASGGPDMNALSTVLYLEYGDFTALLTGDLEGSGEATLMRALDDDEEIIGHGVTILKVGHHGSKNATSKEWLDTIKPEYSVISCGRNNRYGHPSMETMKRLEKNGTSVLDTRHSGAVTFKTDGHSMSITEFISFID